MKEPRNGERARDRCDEDWKPRDPKVPFDHASARAELGSKSKRTHHPTLTLTLT